MIETVIPGAASSATADCNNCPDSAALFESAARELYQTAALLVGEESAALRLVEESVAAAEMDPCADGEAARAAANRELVSRALRYLAEQRPAEMHPGAAAELGGCVETDDLSAAGISRTELDALLAGADRQRMRTWLDGLGPVERSVFVMRAVLGRSGADSCTLLEQATGEAWNEGQVGGAYRSALCSLGSALVHAGAPAA